MVAGDIDLLQQYTVQKSEGAFAELVARHVNLVYSAAVRQVRSPQLAEEIAQGVFADLARAARDLAPDTILTAWLYQVTRRTAIDVVRRESRRRLREQIATEMSAMNATADDWTQIEPLLDDAMDALDAVDRSAVLLRYFENKSFREVGQQLGVSDDAAQKRVSRAVERLRECFAKRGVTVGAGALVAVISANAVQAAPAGLAITIAATAVLSGTMISTSTAITATKAIAMTALQKTLVTATIAVVAGAGIYQTQQASQLRQRVQTLQEQQEPLAAQIQQLQQERDEVSGRLMDLQTENAQLKSNSNQIELLKLRGEVTRLQAETEAVQRANKQNSALVAEATSWLNGVKQLQRYVEQNPREKIAEFEFLTEREWLKAVDISSQPDGLRTPDDYRRAVEILRDQAEGQFGNRISDALRKYAVANNGRFPADLSQLQPYCEHTTGVILIQLYQIKSVTVLSPWLIKDLNIKTDWVISRIKPVTVNSRSRLAIFADGTAYWQSDQ